MVGTGPARGCNGNDVASFAGDNGRDIGGGEDSAVAFPLPLPTFGSSCYLFVVELMLGVEFLCLCVIRSETLAECYGVHVASRV